MYYFVSLKTKLEFVIVYIVVNLVYLQCSTDVFLELQNNIFD